MMHGLSCLIIGLWTLLLGLEAGSAWAISQLDATFGLNGRVAVELGVKNGGHAILVQPDGKIVVAGSSSGAGGEAMNFALLRFNRDGSLDTTFNGEGSILTSLVAGDDEALALGMLADGRIVAGGYSHNGTDRDFALVCYRSNGTLDHRFGVEGAVLTSIGNGHEEITALTVSSDDRITVVGATEGTVGRVLVAARYMADGTLDRSFGEQGISLIAVGGDANAEGLVERPDGSLVISGSCADKQHASAILVGLRADGVLDAGFGDKGIVTVTGASTVSEGYGLSEDQAGLLYMAGSVGPPGRRDAALFRFTRAGQVDSTFGTNGVMVSAIGAEDDVLYDVSAGKNGVTASGFTTEKGSRQFLLTSVLPDGTVTAMAAGVSKAEAEPDGAETVPIQEVRVNGQTKVQIRVMQLWNSTIRIRQLQLSETSLYAPSAGLLRLPASGGTMAQAGQRIGAWFLPSVMAADDARQSGGLAGILDARVITTAFSEGEAVCSALTEDAEGNVLVVGTAEGGGGSSIVAARFAADNLIDRVLDRPGHRSSHITTTLSADITRTTVKTGGEIAESFPAEIVRRGVVFSLKPGPLYRGNVGQQTSFRATEGLLEQMGALIVSEAVAAERGTNTPASAASGERVVEEGTTDNGGGRGSFITLLEHLRPGAVYYIRAYALTADGAIYYGNQVSIRTADACFIATASFGSLLHPGVTILREFRDTYLVQHGVGQWLIDRYYTLSPPMADIVAGNPAVRYTVRLLLLPVIGFAWLALHLGMAGALSLVMAVVAGFGWRHVRVRWQGEHRLPSARRDRPGLNEQ
jgi:uncharacterized delta-60 repeat protein